MASTYPACPMSHTHTRGTAGRQHKSVVLAELKLSQLMLLDCPAARCRVGKGAREQTTPLPHARMRAPCPRADISACCGVDAWARRCVVRVARPNSLTAPIAPSKTGRKRP